MASSPADGTPGMMLSGQAKRNPEWELRKDGPIVGLTVVATVVLVLLAILAIWPFAGILALWLLGLAVAALFNLSLGTLAVGACIEIRHRDWSRFGLGDHLVLGLALPLLAAVDVVFSRWLFQQAGSWVQWGYLGLGLFAACAGGALSWTLLWPHRDGSPSRQSPDSGLRRWPRFGVLSALLGVAAGTIVSGGTVVGAAVYRNAATPDVAPDAVPVIRDIGGRYVAIGDSYSAGQGLVPFDPATVSTGCDRSRKYAYPELLRFAQGTSPLQFTACSGAVVSQILKPRPGTSPVPPQLDGRVHPDVGLVTLTIGGNNILFSKIVIACFERANCLRSAFPPAGSHGVEPVPPGPMASSWAPATMLAIGQDDARLFGTLRADYPHARIVVVGYPYLFPDGRAGFRPDYCASILRRFSLAERLGVRKMEDQFNNLTYEEAVASRIEFVSSVAIWRGHEPCGALGQYTNSIKFDLSFTHPAVDGGTFHPNRAGQQTLAALVSCYLDAYAAPPDPFQPGRAGPVEVPAASLASPSELGLVSPPGSQASLPRCR